MGSVLVRPARSRRRAASARHQPHQVHVIPASQPVSAMAFALSFPRFLSRTSTVSSKLPTPGSVVGRSSERSCRPYPGLANTKVCLHRKMLHFHQREWPPVCERRPWVHARCGQLALPVRRLSTLRRRSLHSRHDHRPRRLVPHLGPHAGSGGDLCRGPGERQSHHDHDHICHSRCLHLDQMAVWQVLLGWRGAQGTLACLSR